MNYSKEHRWWDNFRPKSKLTDEIIKDMSSNYKSSNSYIYKPTVLTEDHSIEYLRNKLIVCKIEPTNKGYNKRQFTFFDSYIQFVRYQSYIHQDNRCCFECILGDSRQKPHFDVDISLIKHPNFSSDDVEDLKDELIESINQVLLEYGVELDIYSDVCIYSSHGKEKFSIHVIINNYYHHNNKESKAFYQLVVENMSEYYAQFIDPAVYSGLQQFRIIGNQKYGSGRIKVFHNEWKFHNNQIIHKYKDNKTLYDLDDIKENQKETLAIIRSSLISWVENCKPLPTFKYNKHKYIDMENNKCINYRLFSTLPKIYNNNNNENLKLTKQDVVSCINLMRKFLLNNTGSSLFPFRFRRVNTNRIEFTRKYPSMCPLCKQTHDSDNPYLIVNSYNQDIYYKCHRNRELKHNIGSIYEDVEVLAVPKTNNKKSTSNINVDYSDMYNFRNSEDKDNKIPEKTNNNNNKTNNKIKTNKNNNKIKTNNKLSNKTKTNNRLDNKKLKIHRALLEIKHDSGESDDMRDLKNLSMQVFNIDHA